MKYSMKDIKSSLPERKAKIEPFLGQSFYTSCIICCDLPSYQFRMVYGEYGVHVFLFLGSGCNDSYVY